MKSIPHLRAVMSELGKRGGKAKSASKIAAARINGKKGGRPKNQPVEKHGDTSRKAAPVAEYRNK